MSKLADAIRRSQRIESAPMGFGAAKNATKATMLVGVVVDAAGAGAAREKGADVVILNGGKAPEKQAGETPLGLIAEKLTAAEAGQLKEAGVDFVVFEPESAQAAALLNENLGFVMRLPETADEQFLRSLEALNLDAVLLAKTPESLTVSAQMELGRIAMLARKPLACRVGADIAKEDLECLRATGVALVITDAVDKVAALKEMVLSLPPKRMRRDERPAVTLPRGKVAEPEEDDDDDD